MSIKSENISRDNVAEVLRAEEIFLVEGANGLICLYGDGDLGMKEVCLGVCEDVVNVRTSARIKVFTVESRVEIWEGTGNRERMRYKSLAKGRNDGRDALGDASSFP